MEVKNGGRAGFCKISALNHFSSACGSNFLLTSVVSFEFGLDFSCLD